MPKPIPKISILLFLLLLPLLAACSPNSLLDSMPDYVKMAAPDAQEAYIFAHEHGDMLLNQPCYCGCQPLGHLNNYDCFIQEMDEVGNVIYDPHAAACGICVWIALDVKRLMQEGWSSYEIRIYIDETYSRYGPPTDTPMPAIET